MHSQVSPLVVDALSANGWHCRCKAYLLDQAGIDGLKAASITVQTEPPEERLIAHKNKFTGEEEGLPESAKPGWGFKQGTAEGKERTAEMLRRRVEAILSAPDNIL